MSDIKPNNLRLAIYARVSTEEQREGQTIDSQISEGERFASERGWLVIGIYQDAGWSGGIMNRPALDRLRDDAMKRLFDAVLINDVDRLARDVTHLGVIKRDLERHGIQVIFRKLPSENSPTHNLMVNILGSFAEFERELIADRTRRGRRHKIEVRKEYLGSNTSYGYRYVPINRAAGSAGFLELIPEEAAVVRQVFHWIAEDSLSARAVLKLLNEAGIRPRKGARRWGKSSILRMLHNEMYTGTWHYNKAQACEPKTPRGESRYRRTPKSSVRIRPRDEWLSLELPEALRLITKDQWEKVQVQLRKNTAFSPRNERHPYLLKSLVWCGGCGKRMVGDPGHGHFSYRCTARCRKTPMISEGQLNSVVWEAVSDALRNPGMVVAQAAKFLKLATESATTAASETEKADAALRQLHTEELRLLEAYRLGAITPVQLGSELERLTSRKQSFETQRSQFRSQSSNINEASLRQSVTDYCGRVLRNLRTLSFKEQQELLRAVVRDIRFDGQTAFIRGHVPLEGLSSNADIDPSSSHAINTVPTMNASQSTDICKTSSSGIHGEIAAMEVDLSGFNLAKNALFELDARIPRFVSFRKKDRWGRFTTWRRLALPSPPVRMLLTGRPRQQLLEARIRT